MHPRLSPSRRRRSRSKLFYILPAVAAIIMVAGGLYFWLHKTQAQNVTKASGSTATTSQSSVPSDPHSDRIRMIMTGDWIAHDSVNAAAKQPDGTYNYLPMVQDFAPVFQKADIRFCNDPILNGGESLGVYGYPKFNSPTEFVTDMGKLGCNLVNTASNHSFDYTQTNINNSVTAWQKVPNMLAVAGENQNQAQHDQVHYFTVKGVKFAFLAYTAYSNTDAPPLNNYGVNIFSQSFAGKQIAIAKQNGAQIIIVSMRWGTEYSTSANSEQVQDAQFLANQGVNLVIGHGSHELQPVQQLTGSGGNKTTVWYSIGNFLNTQEPAETLFNGIPVIDFNTQTHQITDMSFLPIYMHYEWTAAEQKADDISARTNLHLYLLEDTTQAMIDAQQLHTTIADQRQRMQSTLDAMGLSIPLITTAQL